MAKNLEIRIQAVQGYLNGKTLKEIATRYNTSYVTISRWVKWYRETILLTPPRSFYRQPWNRSGKDIESKVMLLKENHPAMTVRRAREILRVANIHISIKGIHSIWYRHGLVKRSPETPYSPYGPFTPETKQAIAQVRLILKQGSTPIILKKAARLLNALPSFPDNNEDLLIAVPDRYLSLRRRLDKLDALFTRIPKPALAKKARHIRETLERHKMYYSSISAGILEILALHWMRTPEEELRLNALLQRRKGNLRDPVLNLALSFLAATAYVELLDLDKTNYYTTRCRHIMRTLPYSNIYAMFADLMTFTTEYGKSLKYYQRALSLKHPDTQHTLLVLKAALAAVIAGEYKATVRTYLRHIRIKENDYYYTIYSLIRALHALGRGCIERALYFLRQCMERSEKESFRNYLYTISTCLAVVDNALDKKKDAQKVLQKYLPLLKKYRVRRHTIMLDFLLGRSSIPQHLEKIPIHRMIKLMEVAHRTRNPRKYLQAYVYAQEKGLRGIFHRMSILYPEPVRILLDKGKSAPLPKALLRLPVFNRETPVYQMKFLGRHIVYKNQHYLKTRFSPQHTALLIHLAHRLGEPGRFVSVPELCSNFWPKSKNPLNRLSHVLVDIRSKIKLPAHLLNIVLHNGSKRLINKGFFITTDYADFENALAEAKAFEHLGEWHLSRDKYTQAFRLLRGIPFDNMYDPWSEAFRQSIINRIEHELNHFTKMCHIHRCGQAAKTVTNWIKGIIPQIIIPSIP